MVNPMWPKGCCSKLSLTQAWRWLSSELLIIREQRRKIQLENLQNGLLQPSRNILEYLSSRRPLRLRCCARGGKAFAAACSSIRSACLFTISRSCLHISHSFRSQQGFFTMFTKPHQGSSQFMVRHGCVSFLYCFSALRNLPPILMPSAHNLLFNNAKSSSNTSSYVSLFPTQTWQQQGGC